MTDREIATGPDPAHLLEDLDAEVETAMEAFRLPGASVAIVHDGEVVLSRGYGVRNRESGAGVTDSTWEEQLRDRLLEPLGMRRSNVSVDSTLARPGRPCQRIPRRACGLRRGPRGAHGPLPDRRHGPRRGAEPPA